MSNSSPPSQNKEQEEHQEEMVTGATEDPHVPNEGCVSHTVAPEPSEAELGTPPRVHCQAWLLDMLDDVRYLISCTNWY